MTPLRVLHVVGSLERGGVETWLMHIVRDSQGERIQHDFAVHASGPGLFENDARALGCRILRVGPPHAVGYLAKLWNVMRQGHYDVVHSHLLHFSGVVLLVARAAGIRGRIAHSHSDSRPQDAGAPMLRRGYLSLMSALVSHTASNIIACSEGAAQALLRGERPGRDVSVVPYGINLAPFSRSGAGRMLRQEHGIPEGVPVFGHVGRMVYEKNHAFLLTVAERMLTRRPDARFVLIGAGELKPEVIERTRALGIEKSVVFPDPGTDHLLWMTDVFDTFLFPSIVEGIPIALIEAQAAGLPCVISDQVVPAAIDVIPSLLHRVRLDAGVDAWCDALAQSIRDPRIAVSQATSLVATSPFNIEQSRRAMERIYSTHGPAPLASHS